MQYFEFYVRLLGIEHPPWRKFLIEKAATFTSLHNAIQDACGWQDYHLFAFHETEKGPVIAGVPDDEFGPPDPDANKVKISSFFTEGGPQYCFYLYDFGDDWWHEVRLLGMVSERKSFLRRLVAGARAFPPEDCGSLPGYEDCIAVATERKPKGVDDVEALREWLGDWHPDAFNLVAAKGRFDL